MRIRFAASVLLFSMALAAPANAQSSGAGDALDQIMFAPPGFPNGNYSAAALGLAPEISVADVLRNLIAAQTQSPPMSSSSSAMVFVFDTQSGMPRRASNSFGPLFAERALTNGKGVLNIAANFQQFAWKSYEGSNLRNDDSGLYWGHFDYDGAGSGYVGVCRMDMNTSVFSVSASYGITDRIDVGVSVPFVRTSVDGSNEFVDYQQITDDFALVPTFDRLGVYRAEGTTSGLGDLLVRGKFSLWSNGPTSVAAAAELRLPTGDLEDMRGTGEFQTRLGAYASHEARTVAPHANLSYAFGSDALPDELSYVVGSDFPVHDRLTLSADVIGRFMTGVTSFRQGTVFADALTINGRNVQLANFNVEEVNWNTLVAATGAKVRIGGSTLLTGNLLFPMNDNGLAHGVTATIGIERIIGR